MAQKDFFLTVKKVPIDSDLASSSNRNPVNPSFSELRRLDTIKNDYKEISLNTKEIFEIERVKDWPKRIKEYNEKQKSKYQMAFKKMKELKFMLLD